MTFAKTLAALSLTTSLLASACAAEDEIDIGSNEAALTIDSGFGTAAVTLPGTDGAGGVVEGPSGTTYGVGYTVNAQNRTQVAVRLLDTHGISIASPPSFSIGSYTHAWANAAAVVGGSLTNDQVVAVGAVGNGGANSHYLMLSRFTKSGLDTTWAGGDGIRLHNIDPDKVYEEGVDVATWRLGTPDARIYVVGRGCDNPDGYGLRACRVWVARFTMDGERDTDWGNNGLAPFNPPTSPYTDEARGIAVQPDGSALVLSKYTPVGSSDTAGVVQVRRLTPGGYHDFTFDGTDGLWLTANSDARSIAVDPANNQILVSGSTQYDAQVAVWRIGANGGNVSSFGTGGKKTIEVATYERGEAVRVDGSGRVVIAVSTVEGYYESYGQALVQLDRYGNLLDTEYLDFPGTYGMARSLSLQPNGRALVGGMGNWSGTNHMTFARYNP